MADAGTPTGPTPLPCVVEGALNTCRNCHSDPPAFGAPMPLMTWDDMQKPSVTDPSKKVYEKIGERIDAGTMPPSPYTLSADAKKALDEWVAAGGPPGAAGQTCTGITGDGGVLSGVGPEYLPCNPQYTYTAHDTFDQSKGFTVPTGGTHNYYMCFVYDATFAPGEQAIAWAPIVDQKSVLHHYIMFESQGDTHPAGSVFQCGALPTSDAKFLMGWAPGGQNIIMPSDTGFQIDPGGKLLLQIHYWNPSDTPNIVDRSGVAVCTTKTPRPKAAGIMAVGPLLLSLPPHQITSVGATCTAPTIQSGLAANGITGATTMNVLGDGPHMHKIGIKFNTTLNHADGTKETLVNVDPFDFNEQTGYPHIPPIPVDLAGGDTITTTCTYDNESNTTVNFGERTEDEMCFDFIMVQPFPVSPLGNGSYLNCFN